MSLSYEFSVGSVRAREKSLFSSADIEQMLNLKSESELVRFLGDKGYGEGKTVGEVLDSNTEKMWKYIKSIAPDFSVFDPFFMQNDIHNLKTVLKGLMFKREYDSLLLFPCTIDIAELKKATESRKFDNLPDWLASAAKEAYDLLAHTKDARLSDGVIDRVAMEKFISEGKKSKSVFLAEYFNTLVFYANIKTAIRSSKYKTTMEYLDKAICECDDFDKQKVISKTLSGNESLMKYLEKLSSYECNKAMKCFSESPAEFEKFAENKLIRLAKSMCRLTNEGAEPLFGYYIGCEYERKAVRIISSGIATRTPSEKIRERLRDIYG